MKTATIALAILATATAKNSTMNLTINDNYSMAGHSTKKNNVSEGNWKIHADDGHHSYSQDVNYMMNKEDPKNKKYVKRTVKKFDEYFLYAIQSKNLEIGSEQGQCKLDTDCGDTGYTTKCCVSAILKDHESGTQHENFRCMNKGIVKSNMDLQINNMTVSMRCTDAMYMGASFAASAATLAAMTLY